MARAPALPQPGRTPRTAPRRVRSYSIPILSEVDGKVRFEDVVEGETMRTEREASGNVRMMIVLVFFCIGAFWGSLDLHWWKTLPSL